MQQPCGKNSSCILRELELSGDILCAGQLTFSDVMKMFRNELLDLSEILNYIKLAPNESAAHSTIVSTWLKAPDGLAPSSHRLQTARGPSTCCVP